MNYNRNGGRRNYDKRNYDKKNATPAETKTVAASVEE